jgi:hypothetical protein
LTLDLLPDPLLTVAELMLSRLLTDDSLHFLLKACVLHREATSHQKQSQGLTVFCKD